MSAWRLCPFSVRAKLVALRALKCLRLVGEKRYQSLRDYIVVEGSGAFDAERYLRMRPDVARAGIDPVWHYCNTGWKEGCSPSSAFDVAKYVRLHPECVASGMIPLVHCLKYANPGESVLPSGDCGSVPDIAFPDSARVVKKTFSFRKAKTGRVAVFAAFSQDGTIPETTLYYLNGLREVVDNIVFVADNPLLPGEEGKIKDLVCMCNCERHGEYDFGSYKRGWQLCLSHRQLRNADEIVFCNDSCYGPVVPFSGMFKTMETRDVDFWGLAANRDIQWHLQSYFWVLKRKVFTSKAFENFILGVSRKEGVKQVVLEYEVPFTQKMIDAGFRADSFIQFDMDADKPPRLYSENPTAAQVYCLDHGSPLVKVKAVKVLHTTYDGIGRTIDAVKKRNPELGAMLETYRPDYGGVTFSVVLPTYNRVHCIDNAIGSILGQSYQKFELIIVDDGSTDGTKAHIRDKYADFIKTGKIKYTRRRNAGVCRARNAGLKLASNEWIAYVDSDNTPVPTFLELFAQAILENPGAKTFYGRLKRMPDGFVCGKPFSFEQLEKGNYIDLGSFVHHRSLVDELGGFDENMTRLVDWDLAMRYTEKYPPVYIPQIVLIYNDSDSLNRISNSGRYISNLNYMRNKRHESFVVTTVVTSYNHERFIKKAVASAVRQKTGWLTHEILLSDDGSTDGTRDTIKEFVRKYPNVRDISSDVNRGISANLRHCFAESSGKYIAVLEGDDYWLWDSKIARQVEFMEKNPDCSMVFSRIVLMHEGRDNPAEFKRQSSLPTKLTGEDFLKDPYQNPIANFSSCMFRADVAKKFPDILFSTRFNEIACGFYIEQIGPIGFIPIAMSAYRIHSGGTWSAGGRRKNIESAIQSREIALAVAAPKYKDRIQAIIDGLKKQLKELGDA